MTKILATLAVAATLATGAVAIPTSQANAACFGCYVGAGIAAGLIGGALIAGATAPAYGYAPVYAGPACGWQTQTSVERLRLAISAGSSLLLSQVVRLNERPRVGPLF